MPPVHPPLSANATDASWQGRVEIQVAGCHGVSHRPTYGDWVVHLDVQIVANSRALALGMAGEVACLVRHGGGRFAWVGGTASGRPVPLRNDTEPWLQALYDSWAMVDFFGPYDEDVKELSPGRFVIATGESLYCLAEPPREVEVVFDGEAIQKALYQPGRIDRVPPGGISCTVTRLTLPPVKEPEPARPPTAAATIGG